MSRRRKRLQESPEKIKETAEVEETTDEASLEDRLGLGNEQLRELLEQELPVPRENLATRKEITEKEADKQKALFALPDLNEFMKVPDKNDKSKSEDSDNTNNMFNVIETKIDRSNMEEYLRVINLNPFADADESMFLEEYDIIPAIFGSGKLLNIPIPYLQTGHGILLIIILLSALIYAPGNPLTEFPIEIRNFFKTGLQLTYIINTVISIFASQKAKSKNLPSTFWTIKCFLLGGIAYYELSQAKDPTAMAGASKNNLSDRKSKSRK